MKYFVRSFVIFIILSFVVAVTPAKPNEFKAVVKHIKTHYKAKQLRIPLVFGLVGIGARIYTKGAVKGLKLAIFQDQDFSATVKDNSFDGVLKNSLDATWTPMIRFYSRKEAQRTYLYAREDGKDFQILLTALEADSAVVLSVKVNPTQLMRFIEKHNNGESILGEFGLGKEKKQKDDAVVIATNNEAKDKNDAAVVADAEPANKLPEVKDDATVPTPVNAAETAKADISIDTKLVSLNAKVLSNSGKPITTLKKEDFTLYENNVKQEIAYFTPVTAPVNLVLLLDFSGSTEKKKDIIKDAAKKFVDSLGPNDRVAVAAFARRFYLGSGFIADKKELKKIIKDIKIPSSGTAYYDAMWNTMDVFKQASGGRNAVVVLTDGVDNSISAPKTFPPKHSFDELLERLAEEDVTIYPLYLDTEYETVVKRHGRDTHETYTVARKQLNQVAEQTGGMLFQVARIEDLNGVYQRVALELKTLYSIAYTSTNDEAAKAQKKDWREIKLMVNQKDAVTRSKRGYYAK